MAHSVSQNLTSKNHLVRTLLLTRKTQARNQVFSNKYEILVNISDAPPNVKSGIEDKLTASF